jgi:hypothetical protein
MVRNDNWFYEIYDKIIDEIKELKDYFIKNKKQLKNSFSSDFYFKKIKLKERIKLSYTAAINSLIYLKEKESASSDVFKRLHQEALIINKGLNNSKNGDLNQKEILNKKVYKDAIEYFETKDNKELVNKTEKFIEKVKGLDKKLEKI